MTQDEIASLDDTLAQQHEPEPKNLYGRASFDQQRSLRTKLKSLPFSKGTLDRMEESFIDATNKMVGERDELWILGDFMWNLRGSDPENEARGVLHRLKCRHVRFVYGNHDDHSVGFAFTTRDKLVTIKVDGQKIVLCHYAQALWDCRHHGAWHLYGHSHSRAEKWLDEIMPGRFSMDVGIDNAYQLFKEYRPFSFVEIGAIFAKRPGFGLIRENDLKGEGEFRTSG